jgi:tetratricopeptide (TPR) repeat protein
MHQLFAAFLANVTLPEDVAAPLAAVVRVQARRMIEIAGDLANHPHLADLAARFMAYLPDLGRWDDRDAAVTGEEGAAVGQALIEIGAFEAARPWFERAVAEAEKGDVHGRVDHDSLGRSLDQVGYCLGSMGRFEAARPWFERAVAEKENGDVQGRVDHESIGSSLHRVGICLASTGQFEAARPWFERAVAEKENGDVQGRVDHESLGRSLNQVGYCLGSMGHFEAARP